ncbi:ABC transporter permease [Photobacterium sp. CCB-ST2H9]|uniref:ABC transporter permease n=1 Tax=Photobacterium sp. CCB-ST2H9 TaxID=2912855 RepID=UPI0020045209|nr:ABC transporter permease [Photobacterium sp. CCB-ST2H9]UTM59700.1 ABC transporter permease [Photobacterium sp. CCB-ST2H9]
MDSAVSLSNLSLAAFYLLLLLPLGVFYRWQLGLSKVAVISVLRMTLQLAVVGIYLQTLFSFQHLGLNLLWLSVMVLVAGFSICRRSGVPLGKATVAVIVGLLVSLLVVLPPMLIGLIHADPWWQAQYLIPVSGMLLGNALTANVLALERWYSSLKEKNNEYQFYLAMGAPHPMLPFQREAVKAALTPQLASMSTLGIVALPGMMTGQILGGTEPILAVKYQIAIMIAILVAVAASVATTLSVIRRFAFDRYGQLKL